jgi:hypothetical protein
MAQHHITEDVRSAVEDQIDHLRSQLSGIQRTLRDHGLGADDLRDEAGSIAGGAAKNARRAAHYAQDEVKAVTRVARKNPAGAGTALTLAAAVGFGIGYAVCQMQHENHRSQWW